MKEKASAKNLEQGTIIKVCRSNRKHTLVSSYLNPTKMATHTHTHMHVNTHQLAGPENKRGPPKNQNQRKISKNKIYSKKKN